MLSIAEIGDKIAVARKMKNLSQVQLANMLSVSAQAVGKWERGESMPDIITFGRLAEIFGTDLNYFGDSQRIPAAPSAAEDENDRTVKAGPKAGWNMSGGNWKDADFSGLHGLAERFSGANIDKCLFISSEMSGLTMKGNNVMYSDFTRSDLRECKFSNVNLESNSFVGCDLGKSGFSRSNINKCDFSGASLAGAVFKWSNLCKLNLSGTVLSGTCFQLGTWSEIVFDGEITGCSFENYEFSRAEFRGAVITNTFFKNCKLKRVKFIDCKVDKLSCAFMKACKADLSGVEIIE